MTQPANPETVFGAFDGRTLSARARPTPCTSAATTSGSRCDDGARRERAARRARDRLAPPADLLARDRQAARARRRSRSRGSWTSSASSRARRRSCARPAPGRPAEVGRWNTTCITCHTTHGVPKRGAHGELDTRVAEFGIACEACHGPGREHVRANAVPLAALLPARQPARRRHDRPVPAARSAPRFRDVRPVPRRLAVPHEPTHAHWNEHGFAYRPGADRERDPGAVPAVAARPRAAGRAHHAAACRATPRPCSGRTAWCASPAASSTGWSSRPATSAARCRACRATRCTSRGRAAQRRAWADDQLALGMDGDAACLRCHTAVQPTTLAAHTHHAADSSGSRCYNCHMPHTTYGLLKAIRSHQVTVPTSRTSVEHRPAQRVQPVPPRPHAGVDRRRSCASGTASPRPTLDARAASVAASLRWALRGDAGQRALLAWGFGWQPARRLRAATGRAFALGVLMDDPYDAVRYHRWRSLRRVPGFEGFEYDSCRPRRRGRRAAPRVLAACSARGGRSRRTAGAAHAAASCLTSPRAAPSTARTSSPCTCSSESPRLATRFDATSNDGALRGGTSLLSPTASRCRLRRPRCRTSSDRCRSR